MQPAVTAEEARSLLARYVQLNNKANKTFDVGLLRSYEGGASFAIDSAGYVSARELKAKPGGAFTYVDPVFYVSAKGGEEWVLTTVRRDVNGGKKSDRLTYLLFSKTPDGWRQIYAPDGAAGDTARPKIDVTAAGTVKELPLTASTGLMTSPGNFAKLYARQLTGGGTPEAKARFAVDDDLANRAASSRRNMNRYARVTEKVRPAPEYPSLALRVADGGALVFTTLARTSRYDVRPGNYVYNEHLASLAGRHHRFMIVNDLIEVVAHIPPRNARLQQFTVLGSYWAAVSGSGS
ncbi:hypothetical protein GCM10023075_08280 [Streptosporangium album]